MSISRGLILRFRAKLKVACVFVLVCTLSFAALSATAESKEPETLNGVDVWPWKQFIETDFPFFSTTLDASFDSEQGTQEDLVPRAIVFPLSDDHFLAYDVDLLRVAVFWKADESPLSNANLAVKSYPYELNKVAAGTKQLPRPNGEIWFRNGICTGLGTGEPRVIDARPKLPEEEQIVRGGLDPETASFLGIDLRNKARVEYEVSGVRVAEQFSIDQNTLVRKLEVSAHQEPIFVVLARSSDKVAFHSEDCVIESVDGHEVVLIKPSDISETVSVSCFPVENRLFGDSRTTANAKAIVSEEMPSPRWKHRSRLPLSKPGSSGALSLEELPLPLDNSYGRAVRPADIDFFESGRAALVTIDGDVWLCDGLQPGSEEVVWHRFASGLHEPLSLRIRNEEVFVFDRNGLWRLLDRDRDGEADYHELFCSRINQSAETREFPLSLELEKDGSFLVSKPGQEGIYSGVLRISPDGTNVSLIATGFRQPFLGYDSVTGHIVASDQQGNWVPSSPVHLIKRGGFYGFRRNKNLDDLPVTPPLTWIPHAECGSATTVVWMRDAKMGPLNDKPVLMCYQPPRLMQVHMDIDDSVAQGGATSLDIDIGSKPVMKAAINPTDGLLYLTGFRIWGTSANQMTFFGRVRASESIPWTIPEQAQVERRGILLRFEEPLDPELASKREAYTVSRWNYKRTSAYGSGHYKLDGSPGTESIGVSSAKLSDDRKSVFLGIRDMRAVMQIEVGYKIELEDQTPVQNRTFLTAHELRDIDLVARGFSDNEVDQSVVLQPASAIVISKPTIERGAALYKQVGCVGCHSVDGSSAGKNGPSWLGLYGSTRKLTKTGESVIANDAYLRESILRPNAKIAEGAINGEAGMPVYAGVLRDDQVDSLLMFIKALNGNRDSALAMELLKVNSIDREWKVDDFRDALSAPLRKRSFEQGKVVFLGASCFSCHQIGNGKGGVLGPDLSKLNQSMRGIELLRHILQPSFEVEDKYKARMFLTLDGRVHKGFIVSEDESEVRIKSDPLSNQAPTVISKSEIEQEKLSSLSPMPVGTLDSFERSQVLDLLAYIQSKGRANSPAFDP
ncbi:MAG: c-type cytochrome [Planctomycetota bacterium]